MVFSDLRDDGSLAADDLGMKLRIYGHGYLEATQSLRGDGAARFSEISNILAYHIAYDVYIHNL